eukprot:TRINITY_DN15884_c0_g1_i2.p1 TRINITY_DN15884_c0_g1~~TRINITY_DN15884_c0_g1_i2.p1  ORF type:complete len:963 (-),score=159.90 TRINITY_DN15884_c0_g1_i2:229-2700(-)
MGFEAVQSGATIGENTATDAATWWRDVEIRRGFASDPAIYKEVMENACWEGLPSNTKDFRTGAPIMKYMKDGSVCTQSYKKAKYSPGLSPATDKALQKLFAEFGIEGRTVGVLLNRYDDGEAMLGSHRHDCWTALFSFGSERILTIDHTPLLCQDGDLVIFGTQRHGVPKMPEIKTGRVTVVVFFYPNNLQKQKMWQTVADEEAGTPSRALVALQYDTLLGSSAADWSLWGLGGKGHKALDHLKRFGMAKTEQDEARAKELLVKFDFDVVKVAALLARDSASVLAMLRSCGDTLQVSSRKARWGHRFDVESVSRGGHAENVSHSTDQDFCVRVLQRLADGLDSSLESDQLLPTGDKKHFRAEDWDGISGDLVAHFLRGGNVRLQDLDSMIKLDQMKSVKLISVGAGDTPEREFFERLGEQQITTLYDLRASESQRDMHANGHCLQHFNVKSLRLSCKARGILYKHMAIGRESAYGVLAHLNSAEGQHALLELAWQAQRSRTAFLGSELDWRHDARLAIAEELVKAGHSVGHLEVDGSLTIHELCDAYPDFLLREEEKLRKNEKMRNAGDLQRERKSAADRSTESVALKLMQGPSEVDTREALREATNQQELKFAQRNLAAMQRHAAKYELPTKVLKGAPKYILEEARAQEAWVEQQKTMDKDKAMPKSVENAASKLTAQEEQPCDLQVECRQCGCFYSWSELEDGDGRCTSCRSCVQPAQTSDSQGCSDSCAASCALSAQVERPASEVLLVECASCGIPASWSLLSLGDGKCPECSKLPQDASAEGRAEQTSHTLVREALVVHPEAASSSSSSRWQRRNRSDD